MFLYIYGSTVPRKVEQKEEDVQSGSNILLFDKENQVTY